MKKLIFAAIVIVFTISASADANTNYSKRVGGYFYTSLSPYGTWIEIGFGTPVWRPTNIRRSWSPYSQGQWIYTNYGWYWDSYEPFGEIVYHYGRWYFDDYYGWIWIPDYEWAPAWVDWRYDDDYIGWAPLSPYALFTITIGIHYTYDYYIPYSHWNYVRYNHFCDRNVYSYYVAPKYKYKIYKKTKVRTNYSYYNGRVRNEGVGYDRIRERIGRTIEKRNIVTNSNPMQLSKERNTNGNSREIRTYIANRDDISRDGLKDVKIERTERKTTLNLSKVEIGRDRTINKTDDTRKDVNTNSTRNKVEEDRKVQERKEVEKRNSEIEKRNSEKIKRNEQIEIQRKATEQMKKTKEVKVPERVNKAYVPEVKRQNNERKVEPKKETQRIEQRQVTKKVEQRNQSNSSTVNRNTEVKRNEPNRQTESRTKDNSSKQNSRTRTR